jgi:hypothetical protein
MFFPEKRTKKRLHRGVSFPATIPAEEQKSFGSFLQKRTPSLLESL